MIRELNKFMAPMARRVSLMVARGVLKRSSDTEKLQTAQVELLDGEVREFERFQNYGYTARAHDGAEVAAIFVGGNRDHGVAVAIDDRRYRVTGLQPGEVAVYDDLSHQITLSRSGIEIYGAGHNIVISGAPVVQVTGGDVIADGVSLKGHKHQDTQPGTGLSGIPVGGSTGGGSGGGGATQGDLDDAVLAAEAAAVAATEAQGLAILAKNDAIQAKIDALTAKGEALIQAGLASGFAQTASDAVTLATEQKNLAGGHASAALTSKNEASSYASDASNYASTASQQVTLATDQKTLASGHASAALTSRNEASGFASDAEGYATTASQQVTLATEQAGLANGYASSALTYKNQASSFADAASGYATTASQQVTLAVEQKDLANGFASAALTYRNEASTFADAASGSASAAAIQYNTLSTTVGDHTTYISQLMTSTDGLNARWGVTLNNNGHVTGFATYSDMSANGGAPTSAFVVAAQKFVFVDENTPYALGNTPNPANIPFRITGGITYIKNAAIENLSLDVTKIALGSLTAPDSVVASFYPTSINGANNAYTTYLTQTDGSPIAGLSLPVVDATIKRLIIVTVAINHIDTSPGFIHLGLINNGVAVPNTIHSIDPSNRMVSGSSTTTHTVMFALNTAANSSNLISLSIALGNGTTAKWTNASQLNFLKITLFCYTGKR